MAKKNALGRGLGALIEADIVQTNGSSSINEVEVDKIVANPNQPRRFFDEESLKELATSIAEIGVVQPITLREQQNGAYQIIAGERRFRAAKLIGLDKIPAYIKTVDDELMMEMALVENIQREDLNAIEIALSYQALIDACKFTQARISERVGKKRATIANYLRLLKLPAEIQLGVKYKKIDMGHARALVNVEDPALMLALYEEVLKNDYSVRKVEELVRSVQTEGAKPSEESPQDDLLKQEYALLGDRLSSLFGSKVKLNRNEKGKGKIVFNFSSDEELENIITTMDKLNA